MPLKLVQKSSGYRQKFSLKKLQKSIFAALQHSEINYHRLAERIAHETLEYLEGQNKSQIDTEAIRQAVIHIMKEDGLTRPCENYEMISLHLTPLKISQVAKRNGARENFHAHKLFNSIRKSFSDAGLEGGKIAENLTKEIVQSLEDRFAGHAVPAEEIRRTASQILKNKGFKKVERFYLLHKYS